MVETVVADIVPEVPDETKELDTVEDSTVLDNMFVEFSGAGVEVRDDVSVLILDV